MISVKRHICHVKKLQLEHDLPTSVNESFRHSARILSSRNFASAKFRKNITLAKCFEFNPCLVLVQPRKTRPDITGKLLTDMQRIQSNKKSSLLQICAFRTKLNVM